MKRIIAATAACLLLSGGLLVSAEAAKPAVTKDETVYAVLDASGSVKNLTVSDWLHGEKVSGELRDRSDLSDIENVKGRDAPKRTGNDLVWSPSGNDVYYRGSTSKSLPFSVRITYWLDGKQTEPTALAGKSGLVKIRIEIKNLAVSKLQAGPDGKRVHAPLAVIVGADLPAAIFRDIEVKGGGLISDGQNNIIAGVLLPGLLDSIQAAASPEAAKGIASLPESVRSYVPDDVMEITARTTRFSFGSFMIAASPSIPELGGINATDKLKEALAGMNQLGEASAAIRSGSAALADGAAQLHKGIGGALDAAKPLLASNPTMDQAKEFIQSDADVQAARDLVAAGKQIAPYSEELKALLASAADPQTAKSLRKLLEDMKGIDLKVLLDMPQVGNLENNIAALGDAMAASDDLYSSFDEKKMAAVADFATGSGALFAAIKNFDDAAADYDSLSGQALASLAAQKADIEAASARAAVLSGFDAGATSAALDSSAQAQASFVQASAFLDDSARLKALTDKLASGAELSKDERAQLSGLLSASKAMRSGAKAGAEAASSASKALPALSAAAAFLPATKAAAAAAESLGKKTLPALEAAKASHSATKAAVAAATKTFDAKTVASISTNVKKIGQVKAAYAKNKGTLKLVKTFLSMKAGNAGFKAQFEKIGALQKDAAALGPLVDKLQVIVDSDAGKALLTAPEGSQPLLSSALDDVSRLEKYLPLAEEALSQKNVNQVRDLVAKMPELESKIDQLGSGVAQLDEGAAKLAAGTAQFDEEGVKKLVTQLGGVGTIALGYLEATDKVSAAAKEYRIFSLAPSDAKTKLKFVMRTEEIK
jgi:X-X-X-Leu-X-X-Gly heptad repeats